MKIKQFLGADMRDVLRQIRLELGADAVILSTRAVGQGVEVSAACDSEAVRKLTVAAIESLTAPAMPVEAAAITAPAIDALPTPVSAAQQLSMSEELRTLRQLLERQLAALAWNDYTRREPVKARALAELTGLGIARDVAMQIANALPADLDAEAAQHAHLELLARRIQVSASPAGAQGALAVIGASGSGKTTMVAKLALRHVLEHGNDSLSIITIDDEHIGAADQARSLGRLLGVPSFRFANGAEFAAASARFASQQRLLIDTPALSADDDAVKALGAALDRAALPVQRMLMFPASVQNGVLNDMLRRAEPLAPNCCAITRCDEVASLGGVLSTLVRSGLPVACMSNGSNLAEDLHAARPQWLVARAVELARAAGSGIDAEYLAQHLGGELHAAA